MSYNDYAPYFRDGRLFLPEKTVTLLLDAGLDPATAQAAKNGFALDDHRQQIARINAILEGALAQMEEDTQAFRALNSDEARFMLTGKPSARV